MWPRTLANSRPSQGVFGNPAHGRTLRLPSVAEDIAMLRWALIFLVVGLIAGVLGFTGIAGASVAIAKFLFFLFVAIFLVFLVLGLTVFRAADR
jgi:uncharacterized membrane protein YtjA (UPF0391 family)